MKKNIINQCLKKFAKSIKILRNIHLCILHYKINKRTYSTKIVFNTLFSRIINFYYMCKLTKKRYENFISFCIYNYDDIYDTKLPNGFIYSPIAFQIQEMYSRGDNTEIENLFKRILHYSDKKKYKTNKEDVNKTIFDLTHNHYTFSSRIFPDLIIDSKKIKKYFSKITISLEAVGDSFFKIVFNCYFNDKFYYKLWMASTTHFVPEVKLSYSPKKSLIKYTTSALQTKKNVLANYEKESYFYLRKFINKITKGIFWNVLSDYPCTFVSSLKYIPNILFGGLQTNNIQATSFFDAVIDSTSKHVNRYVSHSGRSIFIPISLHNFSIIL